MARSKKRSKQTSSSPEVKPFPLSARAVYLGYESAMSDTDPKSFPKVISRFKNQKVAYGAILSVSLRQQLAFLVPQIDPEQTVAMAAPVHILGGAALFYECLRQEAALRKIVIPRIDSKDVMFWARKFDPSESVDQPQDSTDFAIAAMANMVVTSGQQAKAFDMEETEFCLKALEAFRPELDWTNEHRHSVMMGAADLRSLYDARYERRQLEATLGQ